MMYTYLLLMCAITTQADDCVMWQRGPESESDTCLPSSESYATVLATETAECGRECLQRYPGCSAANFVADNSSCELFWFKNDSAVISPCPGVTLVSIQIDQSVELEPYNASLSKSICGDTWRLWDGWCYQRLATKLRFDHADTECQLRGGSLVSIHNSLENRFVAGLVDPGERLLTGLIKENTHAWPPRFKWTDRSPVDYFNWQSSQPDGRPIEQSNCVFIHTGNDVMDWSDDDCYQPTTFVCKKSPF